LPIINVMSDLPAVPSERPEPLDEDLEEAVEEGAVEEAALPLRLLADGPTPLDAHEYFEELEPAHDAPDEAHVDARGGIVEVEPDSFEEVEPEPRSGDAEPDSFEEVEPERDLDAGVELEPERAPESIQEIEPERDSDLGEEIPIDMVDEPEAQPLRPPLPPQPPPLRRPPALASPDLPPYSSPVPPAAAEAPVSAPPARAPGDSPAPPLAAPPPPSKPAPAAIETPPPTTDTQRRKKPWWEELFGEDFSRTMDRIEHNVVRREVDFIEERLGMEKGAVILDLACGPGQHAVEMASRGYSVVGYDLSLAMLARASDEAQERGQKLNFLQGDMRDMAFEEMFDAVYCWATSFGYFEEEKNADVLGRIHRALRSGGMLLLDVINRDYVSCRQPSLVWFEGDGCVCMDEMQVDFFTSRLKVKRTVMFEDGRSRELDYSIRIYGLHELGKLLHEAGFKVTEVTGHPAHPGVFFGSESPRLIVLAERA
jgi:SAM-dependent methyltransferase